MKRIYIKPIISVISMGNSIELLAGSGGADAKVGGGSDGKDNSEGNKVGSSTGSGLTQGAKKHSVWSSWDDWE